METYRASYKYRADYNSVDIKRIAKEIIQHQIMDKVFEIWSGCGNHYMVISPISYRVVPAFSGDIEEILVAEFTYEYAREHPVFVPAYRYLPPEKISWKQRIKILFTGKA